MIAFRRNRVARASTTVDPENSSSFPIYTVTKGIKEEK
jgi:hypothetical protein